MLKYPVAYIATAIVFFGLDFIWLSNMANGFYRNRLGAMLLDQPNMVPAALFYLVYIAGVVYFAVLPAVNVGSWGTALISGALLGLVSYGTYDITNLATLKNWPVSITVVDMAWGTLLTGAAAITGYFVTTFILAKAN